MVNNEKRGRPERPRRNIAEGEVTDPNDHELLEQYLMTPVETRDQQFPNTARAATMVGLSRRTIQFWVEIGEVQAVFIGGKYRISIESLRECLKRRGKGRGRG